jgi:type I restriction-modification system DNA methylase subunit
MVFKPERIYHARISKNPEDNTFSMWFEDRPEKLVMSLLYAVGFKVKNHEREFYHNEDSSMMEFAEDLKSTLSLGCFPFNVPYTPSYAHTQDSIDAGNFSVITFHYENQKGISETESILILERVKERREGFGHILGVFKFGKRLQSFNATYRTGKAEARDLLKNGVYEISFPTPFGSGCPARLDFDSKDRPFRHETGMAVDDLAPNTATNDQADDRANDEPNEVPNAKESARASLPEQTNDRSNDGYRTVNQETNDRSDDRFLARVSLPEQANDGSNDGSDGGFKHCSRGRSLDKTSKQLEASTSLTDEEMIYDQISNAEHVPSSFFDLFENKYVSREDDEPLDQSRVRDEFNLLASQKLLRLNEKEVDTLWSIYSTSERGISVLDDDNSEEVQETAPKMFKSVLEHAYWRGEEAKSELRIVVDGEAYHENELYFALLGQLRKASAEIQNLIGQEITERFKAPNPYNKFLIGFGAMKASAEGFEGNKSAPAIEAFFLDIDNHYREENKSMESIYKFLMDQLVPAEELADLPMQKPEKQGLNRAQNQSENAELVDAKPRSLGAKKRFETNKKIESIIDAKKESGVDFTTEDKELFQLYSGYGGLISQGASGAGILYEYYTSYPIIEKMWGLAYKYGFTGGRILEPSVGIGDFLKIAPVHADVTAFEINPYSATICELLYPTAKVYNKAFETIFFNGFKHLKDNHNIGLFDLVIGNPPYGEFSGKYAGMGEKKYTKAKEYDHYFITRGIDLLRPGGLLVFIISSSFLDSSKSHSEVKKRIADKAELKDAYRLPNGIFKSTDIGTDIVVFKKR